MKCDKKCDKSKDVIKPKKWTDVYPHGTKEGDEECKFFIALARNKKYRWRSLSALAKESGLSRERVEEIINKYYKKGLVFQDPKNEDQWGYWERVPEMLPTVQKSVAGQDQSNRLGESKCCDAVINNQIKSFNDLDAFAAQYWAFCKRNDKATAKNLLKHLAAKWR